MYTLAVGKQLNTLVFFSNPFNIQSVARTKFVTSDFNSCMWTDGNFVKISNIYNLINRELIF